MACRENALLFWATINWHNPYPDRLRKMALGSYARKDGKQVGLWPSPPITLAPHLCAVGISQAPVRHHMISFSVFAQLAGDTLLVAWRCGSL